MNPATLDLDAIQGVLVRGYRLPVGSYVYLRVTDAAAARGWVGSIVDEVTTAAPWDTKPASTFNLAFSAVGLAALGVPDTTLAGFAVPFLQGMAARAGLLGDVGHGAPGNWPGPLGGPDVHVVVMLLAGSRTELEERIGRLTATLGPGLVEVGRQDVAMLPSGTEHFGYADGFSQPDVEGAECGPRTGSGAPPTGHGGKWRPIRAGEFILGYPDEEGVLPAAPAPDELGRNGSYVAVRKLHQDVVGFRNLLSAAAKVFPGSEDLLAAKLVGRWRDGTPLDVAPTGPAPELAADPDRNNTFDYAEDPQGFRCPIGAHVRRVNPRLSMPFNGALVNRHRLVRRGLPYGPALPEGAADDGVDRGVLFVCFQADLQRQFEFVQSQWLNDGNAFGLGTDKDPLLGNNDGTGKFTVFGEPPVLVAQVPRLVTPVGGEYLFAPGINGLRHLAQAPANQ